MTEIYVFVLYGYETWSLTLTEEHKLTVFENRVLRKIFGPNRQDVTGDWRKLHNEELYDFYSSPNMITTVYVKRIPLTEVARLKNCPFGVNITMDFFSSTAKMTQLQIGNFLIWPLLHSVNDKMGGA
jgi:hypothetical protein